MEKKKSWCMQLPLKTRKKWLRMTPMRTRLPMRKVVRVDYLPNQRMDSTGFWGFGDPRLRKGNAGVRWWP